MGRSGGLAGAPSLRLVPVEGLRRSGDESSRGNAHTPDHDVGHTLLHAVSLCLLKEIVRAFVVSQSAREDLQLQPSCSVGLRVPFCPDETSRNPHLVVSECPG